MVTDKRAAVLCCGLLWTALDAAQKVQRKSLIGLDA